MSSSQKRAIGRIEARNSVWHPQRGPLFDYPLAVCDASTVNFEADTMAADLVTEHEITETVEVQYNSKQRWYYLAQQQPDELLLFKNVDSRCKEGVPPGIARMMSIARYID